MRTDLFTSDRMLIRAGRACYPRWIKVELVEDVRRPGIARVVHGLVPTDGEEIEVRLCRCSFPDCASVYALFNRPGADPDRCRQCDRAYLTSRQRYHRLVNRQHRVRRQCSHCGRPMEAERTSKRYCSTACRVAAHRKAKGEAPGQAKGKRRGKG
jgi:hypothetical protein